VSDNTRLPQIALAVLLAVLAAASFFPETFITDFPVTNSEKFFPLTLLLPLLMIVTIMMIVRERSFSRIYPVDAVFLAFSTYVLARNLSGDIPIYAVKYVLISVCVYYLTAALAVDRTYLKRIFFFISVILLVTTVYGLIEYGFQDNVLYKEHISVGDPVDTTQRVGSLLAHPVVFGAFLVQAIPFAIFLWVRGWKRWLRLVGMATSLLAIVCLLLTTSKGSWIAAFIVGIAATIYFAMTRGKKSVIFALALVLLVGAVTGLFYSRSSLSDVIRVESSVNVREAAWRATMDGIWENLVFGVGLKQGQAEVLDQIPLWWMVMSGGFEPPVDNNYLNILLEEGVIGGVMWLAFIVLIVIGGYRQVKKNLPARFMLVAAYLSIIGLMINMVTFDAMLIWPNLILFLVAAGILRGQYGMQYSEGRMEQEAGELAPKS
jgi:hypothetical protein